jgi:hypothetical protein
LQRKEEEEKISSFYCFNFNMKGEEEKEGHSG